jgi:hypothetical protein
VKRAEQRSCLFAIWWVFCTLVGLAAISFVGWLAYQLVMHFTHGGAS